MCVELCAEGDGVYFWPKNGFLAADSSMNIGNGWVGDKIALSHGQILKTMKIYSSLDALELQDALKYNPVLKARASQLTPSPSLEGIGAACSESLEQQYDSYKGLVSAVAQSDSKDILWTVAEHPFGPILLPDSLIHMIWDPNNPQQVQKRDDFVQERPRLNLQRLASMYAREAPKALENLLSLQDNLRAISY